MDPRIIRAKLEALKRRSVVRRWPVEGWETKSGDHLAPGEYQLDADWSALAGEGSWQAGKTVFLRAQAQTPTGAPLEDLRLEFDIQGMEGLLSIDGRPYAGLDANHTSVALPAAGSLSLQAEFVSVLAAAHRPELRRERGRVRGVSFVQVSPDILSAYYDIWFAWEASVHARGERRKQLLESAVEDALLQIDLTSDDDGLIQDANAARELLSGRIRSIGLDPEAGRVFLTGHSHIDVAWLWPLRETVRKTARTFSTACRLLERYPNYRFSCSQPQLYAYVQRYYPELYAEVEVWIKEGRWECTGAMWVEPDCNVPSGESLIRQVLYGTAYFNDAFGARPRACWLPDVFGYPASLPGILKGCGLEYFMTCKLHWQARNPFPRHLFWWEGIDGSRLLAHIPKLPGYYNGWPKPEQLVQAWDNFKEKGAHDELLFPFGFGDGGGGPTEEMLEFADRAEAFPGLPACRQGLEEDYFDDVVAAAPDLPAWVGELYLETHRGTYTTHGEAKRANRRGELTLRGAEIAGLMANAVGARLDLSPLRDAWLNLLLLQFHDILPGSSIGEVYREAAVDHAAIIGAGQAMRSEGLQAVADRLQAPADVVAFNSLSWDRSDVASAMIAAPADEPVALALPDGHVLPVQVAGRHGEQVEVVFSADSLPSVGYAALSLVPAALPAETSLRISARRMENQFFVVELDGDGALTRLYDKRVQREVLPEGAKANLMQLFQDGPEREAAWNVHATFSRREYAWDDGGKVEVMEQGPVRGSVRVHRRFRGSSLQQDIVLYDQVPRIDFVTHADWQARQVLLKVAFPVAVRSARATYEIQFGAVERPTHTNTSWDEEKFEVCGHRWADLSEAGYGVSLLNDSKYGYDAVGNVLRLTLLRGTERPDPDADRGAHAFTYALLPHVGDWREAETVRRAAELNVPVTCLPANGSGGTLPAQQSFIQVDGPAILETAKPAEDGNGWILRFYEPHGGRGSVSVRGPGSFSSVSECNHVEQDGAEIAAAGDTFSFPIGPFEIRSFRVTLA